MASVLRRLFGLDQAVTAIENGGTSKKTYEALNLEAIAIRSAIGYIAAAISESSFRTYLNHKEIKEDEAYLWNVRPNANQTSTQFLYQLVASMVYDGGALCVEKNGQLFIADQFCRDENQGFGEDIFSGITVRGTMVEDMTSSEVMFFQLNDHNIRAEVSELIHEYEKLIEEAVSGYKKSYADKGVLNISNAKRGKADDEKVRKQLIEKNFKSFFSAQSAVLPLYDGYTYTPQSRTNRNTSEINDVKTLSDEIYNRTGQAFRIPPALLKGEVANNLDSIRDTFMIYGVHPIVNVIEEEIISKRYGAKSWRAGSYMMIDTSQADIGSIIKNYTAIEKWISSGYFSIDDIKRIAGEEPLDTEASKAHYMTLNYAAMNGKGGENT